MALAPARLNASKVLRAQLSKRITAFTALISSAIPFLGDAVETIGSPDVREDFAKLKRVANDFRALNGYPPIP